MQQISLNVFFSERKLDNMIISVFQIDNYKIYQKLFLDFGKNIFGKCCQNITLDFGLGKSLFLHFISLVHRF